MRRVSPVRGKPNQQIAALPCKAIRKTEPFDHSLLRGAQREKIVDKFRRVHLRATSYPSECVSTRLYVPLANISRAAFSSLDFHPRHSHISNAMRYARSNPFYFSP
jgi:hypothetical protein